MSITPRLALPLLAAAQAQKHVTHNEALVALDTLVQLAVLDRGRTSPPMAPATGDRHIVGVAPDGAWAGQSGHVAAFERGVWTFHQPRPGWLAWVADERRVLVHDGGDWSDIEVRRARSLGVNVEPDGVNRFALASAASLFTHAGADHRLTINRASGAATASQIFAENFSARAELGLLGAGGFQLKTSGDGASFRTALAADDAGIVRTPERPVCRYAMTGAMSDALPATTWVAADQTYTAWAAVAARPAGLFDPVTGLFTASTAGLHRVAGGATVCPTTSGCDAHLALWRDGTMVAGAAQAATIASSGAYGSLACMALVELEAGDTLDLRLFVTAGGVKLINGGYGFFEVEFAG